MITQTQKDTLKKYADLKKEINILDNKAEELKGQVLTILQDNELAEINIGLDKITLSSKRAWKYTGKVKELKTTLDDQKKLEERTGEAEYTENFFPKFIDSDNKKEKSYE